MAETRTDLVVNARAKGFQQVQQQAGKLVDAATKAAANQAKGYSKMEGSTRAYRKEIKALEKQLADLGKQQLSTMKAMQGMDKVSGVYKQLKENLKNLGAEATRTGQRLALTKQTFGPKGISGQPLTAQQMARGGFMQGFAQSSLGIQLQRGPGMWQQAAGMATGRAARGFAGAPFGGVEGLTQALAGIPLVGTATAGQLSTAMGFAGGALGLQRSRVGAMPLFGGGRQMQQARRSAEQEADRTANAHIRETRLNAMMADLPAGRTEEVLRKYAKQKADERLKNDVKRGYWRNMRTGEVEIPDLARRAAADMAISEAGGPEAAKQRAEVVARQMEGDEAERKATEGLGGRRRGAGGQAARQTARDLFKTVRKAGKTLGGLSEAEAIEAMTPILQRGGGGIEEAQRQGMVQAGFAAQTAYGVGPEVSGAFLQAGRRGGVVGAEGRGGEAMADTIGQGLALGLEEGSELQDYMAQMANDIASWKQTGMPINTKSIQAMSMAVASTGLGGIRGAAIGEGLAKAGQKLATSGVQDSIDLLMLQTMGGFKGGGMEEYEKAQIRLEEMGGEKGWDEGTVKSLVEQLMAAGGGDASGREVVQRAFARKGITMRKGEVVAFEKSMLRPGEMSAEERAQADKVRTQMGMGAAAAPGGVAGMAGQAEEIVSGAGESLRRAAQLQNKQNDVGGQILPTMLTLQESQAKLSNAFTGLATGPLKNVSGMISDFTGALEKMATNTEAVTAAMGRLVASIF